METDTDFLLGAESSHCIASIKNQLQECLASEPVSTSEQSEMEAEERAVQRCIAYFMNELILERQVVQDL